MHLIVEYPKEISWDIMNLEERNKKEKNEKEERKFLISHNENNSKEYGLNCIITTRFNNKIKNEIQLRTEVYEKISAEVKNKFERENDKNKIEWIACNSLGAEDMVFIILADDIKTFGQFANIIKSVCIQSDKESNKQDNNEKIELFMSVSSFIGFNNIEFKSNPEADLIMRLNCKSSEAVDNVINKVKEIGAKDEDIHKLILGKYILDVRIPSSENLLSYFHTNAIFNGDSQFYKDNIKSSRSYWILNDSKNETKDVVIKDKNYKVEDEKYELSDEKCENDITVPMVHFILKEYETMLKSDNIISWRNILYEQYMAAKNLIDYYRKDNQMQLLYPFLRQIQNVLLHIKQAVNPVAEVPYHNYAYSGSYNDILKMYYGVISTLLKLGYSIPHDESTEKYPITFCVDFESAQDIHSDMYISPYKENLNRFVVFHLPFEAFTDIRKTVQYLIHEVFHYIAPYSREKRNKILLILWSEKICIKLIEILKKTFCMEDSQMKKITEILLNSQNSEEKIYAEIKKTVSDFDELIINDFTQKDKSVFGLNKLVKDICKIYLDNLRESDFEVYRYIYTEKMNGTSDENEDTIYLKVYQEILKYFDNNKTLEFYFCDEMTNIALALKEAFCDINMIEIFDLSLEEYVKIFYDMYLKKVLVNCKNTSEIFPDSIDYVKIGSKEKRLGLVFDFYCMGKDEGGPIQKFKKNINSNNKSEDLFEKFKGYCSIMYSKYLESENLMIKKYDEIFNEIIFFWEKSSDYLEGLKNIREVWNIESSITSNINFINIFKNANTIPKICDDAHSKEIEFLKQKSINFGGFGEYNNLAVRNISEYLREVKDIASRMKEDKAGYQQSCWYRGVCEQTFSLLPSLHRMFDENSEEKIGMSPYAYQTKVLKDAYFETLSSPSLWTDNIRGIMEHTCCLQHYGLYTNLLDFSLDMFVALHFALNPDIPEDREKVTYGYFNPKVVIFNPIRYSRAIQALSEGFISHDNSYKQISSVMFDSCNEKMESYFVTDMSSEYSYETTKIFYTKPYVANSRIDRYPKPVIIRHSNSRVMAQNGTFVAYDLYALRDNGTKDFSYMDLKSIQESYLKLFSTESDMENAKFLKEVYIDPIAVDEMRKELEIIGVTTPKVYPELDRIFRGIEK